MSPFPLYVLLSLMAFGNEEEVPHAHIVDDEDDDEALQPDLNDLIVSFGDAAFGNALAWQYINGQEGRRHGRHIMSSNQMVVWSNVDTETLYESIAQNEDIVPENLIPVYEEIDELLEEKWMDTLHVINNMGELEADVQDVINYVRTTNELALQITVDSMIRFIGVLTYAEIVAHPGGEVQFEVLAYQ